MVVFAIAKVNCVGWRGLIEDEKVRPKRPSSDRLYMVQPGGEKARGGKLRDTLD